jgi:hypothetical protein
MFVFYFLSKLGHSQPSTVFTVSDSSVTELNKVKRNHYVSIEL